MSMNHHTPSPAPQPLCAIYLPQLSLLVLDQLEATQEKAIRDHLADCEYCQWRLREFEILQGALHRHFGVNPSEAAAPGPRGARGRPLRAEVPPVFTLEDIMHASQQDRDTQARPTQPPPRLPERSAARRRMLTAFGAIAAVLVLAVLAASLFANLGSRNPRPAAQPTPTRDTQAQAYLAVLQTYLRPLSADIAADDACDFREGSAPVSNKLNIALSCRPAEAAAVRDAQALAAHLTVPPPARWQTADAELKSAVAATIRVYTQLVAALDAQNVSQWEGLYLQLANVFSAYCAPLAQINADQPLDSLFKVAPVCGG